MSTVEMSARCPPPPPMSALATADTAPLPRAQHLVMLPALWSNAHNTYAANPLGIRAHPKHNARDKMHNDLQHVFETPSGFRPTRRKNTSELLLVVDDSRPTLGHTRNTPVKRAS
jgi:hypothetical protein